MPANLEIKARVHDAARLRRLAERLSATPAEILHQHDTFFHCREGRLKLRQFTEDAGELIAYSRADIPGAKRSDYEIARTATPEELRDVLAAALGVKQTVVKTRTLLRVGQTRIHLDEVAGLGSFVELEFVLKAGQAPDDARNAVRELMNALEIRDADLLEGAYADLLPPTP